MIDQRSSQSKPLRLGTRAATASHISVPLSFLVSGADATDWCAALSCLSSSRVHFTNFLEVTSPCPFGTIAGTMLSSAAGAGACAGAGAGAGAGAAGASAINVDLPFVRDGNLPSIGKEKRVSWLSFSVAGGYKVPAYYIHRSLRMILY